ncbi:MAG TPA: bifunctional phosphoglucose/phosphomannose isomerase [Deltaproteobacteria bacterium]|nr:bifunctional phosphoglucose/phosphomannose isomerase [Deltaproteobacteria bacterium]
MALAMYQSIRNFPQQFLETWNLVSRHPGLAPWKKSPESRIYYAAMGGSSLPADLLNDYWDGAPRLEVVRDYRLPKSAGPQDLLIAASFSGNTEETLAAFEDGLERGCRSVAMSNAGALRKLAEQKGVPWIAIPDCIQPRSAAGYFFAAVLTCLHRLEVLPSPLSTLEKLTSFLVTIQEEAEAQGKKLAEALQGFVPIVYGPTEFYAVCRIWKIKFNENAKIQSFFNVLPELNHNEMVGFTKLLMKPALLMLESRFMNPRLRRRMDVMQELLEGEMPVHRLRFKGDELLHEMFASLAVGDYASYHLAKNYGMDPAPVAMVEAFKRKL